ncbi:MAG: hypothetical protein ABMA25_25660 [Ilumatobacteraceae bacterium]
MRGSIESIRSRTGRVRLAGLAVAAVLALTGAACSSNDTPNVALETAPSTTVSDALSTGAALEAVRAVTGRLAPAPGENTDLVACPMGDMETLAGQGPAEVSDMAIGVATTYQYVFQSDLAGENPVLTCVLESPDGVSSIGLSMGEVVPNFKEDTIRVLSDFELAFEQEYPYLGGTMLPYCATPLEGTSSFCEVDWFDGNVWVGVFITSDTASVAAADQWLRALLLGVLDATVASAATVQAS